MRSLRSRRGIVATAVVAAAFLGAPAIAGALGVSPRSADGRALASGPKVSQGWGALGAADAWAKDHLPLRNQAIQLQGTVMTQQLGMLSSQAAANVLAAASARGARSDYAIPGRGGYIFYGDDFPRECSARGGVTTQLAHLDRLAQVLRAQGKRVVVVVTPDKSSVMAGYLRPDTPDLACFRAGDTQIRRGVAATTATRPGWVNMFRILDNLAQLGPQPYWRRDTHWSPAGGAAYARAVAGAIDPALAARTTPRWVNASKVGDSGRLLGITAAERLRTQLLGMPGGLVTRAYQVPGTALPGYPEDSEYRATARGRVWPGRTVIIGDSFTKWAMDSLRPLFADLTFVHEAHSPMSTSLAALRGADTVVLQVVERHLANLNVPLMQPAFLTRVAAQG